ncbi:S41 family peptidase [Patiriisocius sp. Uisw_047]|jgi:C-terminal processing protease CtpA/Prc|uniref:S41 family peptidase n=1 Tax=Patiriisocius sp. Uisw_047 TaxID=3230969 RepID=UPI0039E8D031
MIKNAVLLVFIIISQAGCKSVGDYNEEVTKNHSIVDLQADVAKAYHQLQRNHPRLYQYISKEQLDTSFDSLQKSIKEPLTSMQFYLKLAPVVKMIGQGHISVVPPQKRRTRKVRNTYKDKKFDFYTSQFKYIDNHLILTRAINGDSLLVGSELLAVESETPQELIERYNTNVASDGYNKTFFESFVGNRFQRFYARENGFLDSLLVTYKLRDSVFKQNYTWVDTKMKKDSTKLDSIIISAKPKKLTKEEKKTRKLENRKKRKDHSKYGYLPKINLNTRNMRYIGKDSTTAYMKIRSFTNGKYEAFYEESFKILDSLETKNLIIDLRDNGGGRLTEINDLYKHLALEDFTFINESEVTTRTPFLNMAMSNTSGPIVHGLVAVFSPIIVGHNLLKTQKRDGKIYYCFKQSKEQSPYENNYKGALYVLINGNSFSASSVFSTNLKGTGRATFVGQETGGAYNGTVAGLFKPFRLPTSNVTIRMGLMQIDAPFKIDPDGYGVTPDVEINAATLEDYQLDKDPAIEWVLDAIENEK